MQFRKVLAAISFTILALFTSTLFAADNASVLGTWNLNLNVQGNSIDIVLNLSEGTNGLEGTWGGPQGSTPISDASFDGTTLKFSFSGQQGPVPISATITDGAFAGNISTPAGDLPVTGKKAM